MANIKVTYGSISRRLTISSTTTWSEIETQFRNLFNIPKEFQIVVSYTDEEGDVITLSSDLELQEVLSNNSNNTIKFILTTSIINNLNDDNNVLDDREKSTDTIIDEETSNLINAVSSIQIEDSNNDKITSKYNHVTITDEVDDPLFNQQQEIIGEKSKNAAESNNNVNVKEKNPSVEENQENQENQESQENNDYEPEFIVIITRNPWLHRRRERFEGCNPYYSCHTFGGRSRYGHHSDENTNRNAFSRGYGCGRYYRRRQQISSEIVAEKINTLHSMGFFNDNLEELVRKYNGNLETIIEVILFNQQNEKNNETVNKQVVREENNEKDQPMEIEEENNKPYVL